jgi:uncharacterized protein (TIGR02996 family)
VSDEAAFLAALQANPADDTARLVYADWLDEHNAPQKAEYLRLVVALAQQEGNLVTGSGAERFVGLAVALSKEWRMAAGSRFSLVLDSYWDHIRTHKFVRELTGCGLGEAKRMVENLPHPLLSQIPFEDASRVCEAVRGWEYLTLRIAPFVPHSR